MASFKPFNAEDLKRAVRRVLSGGVMTFGSRALAMSALFYLTNYIFSVKF
jgi:hypothetical protein